MVEWMSPPLKRQLRGQHLQAMVMTLRARSQLPAGRALPAKMQDEQVPASGRKAQQTTAAAAPVRYEPENPFAKAGFFFLCLYLFFSFSRVLDVSFYYLKLPFITLILTILCLLLG